MERISGLMYDFFFFFFFLSYCSHFLVAFGNVRTMFFDDFDEVAASQWLIICLVCAHAADLEEVLRILFRLLDEHNRGFLEMEQFIKFIHYACCLEKTGTATAASYAEEATGKAIFEQIGSVSEVLLASPTADATDTQSGGFSSVGTGCSFQQYLDWLKILKTEFHQNLKKMHFLVQFVKFRVVILKFPNQKLAFHDRIYE